LSSLQDLSAGTRGGSDTAWVLEACDPLLRLPWCELPAIGHHCIDPLRIAKRRSPTRKLRLVLRAERIRVTLPLPIKKLVRDRRIHLRRRRPLRNRIPQLARTRLLIQLREQTRPARTASTRQ
jgi:hypothetical protein